MADIALLPHGPPSHLRIRASTMSSAFQPLGTVEVISSPLLNRRVAFCLLLICGIGTIFVCDAMPISLPDACFTDFAIVKAMRFVYRVDQVQEERRSRASKIEPDISSEQWPFLNVSIS